MTMTRADCCWQICSTPQNCMIAGHCVSKKLLGSQGDITKQPQPVVCAIPGGSCLRRYPCKVRCREEIHPAEKMVPPFKEIYPTDERELRTKTLLDKAKLTPGERMELTMLLNHKWAKPERNC